jgi:hypothetical protein
VRELYGDRADRFAEYLMIGDPLADDVVAELAALPPRQSKKMLDTALDEGIDAVISPPPALARFFEHVDRVPLWVDWDTLDRGGTTYLRCGGFTIFAMMCASLPVAYSSPAGNKPLIFSGRLVQMAPRRLFETSRWLIATCKPGGLKRFSDGFKFSVRVRLMHAQVRRLLMHSGRWNLGDWGIPLNQGDTAGTSLLFSAAPLIGLRSLGFHFTPEEIEGVMQLWRYSGWLMGVAPELLCATEQEAVRLGEMIFLTQAPPDEDSRALIRALMEEAPIFLLGANEHRDKVRWLVDVCYQFSRTIIGDELADALGYPRVRISALPMVRAVVAQIEALRRVAPRGHSAALEIGTSILHRIAELGLGSEDATFSLPQQLDALFHVEEKLWKPNPKVSTRPSAS